MHIFTSIILLTLKYVVTNAVSVANRDSKSQCLMISLSNEEMENLREVAKQLHMFLPRNMEEGHKKLSQILSKFGGLDFKVSPKDPMESHILHLQLLLHMKTLEMFGKLEHLIAADRTNQSSGFNNSSQKPEQDEIQTPQNFLKNIHNIIDIDPKMVGSFSPYALAHDALYKRTDSHFRPHDCSDLLVAGASKSGIYNIYPYRCTCSKPVEVYCDMETDGGGWTVFLSRQKANVQLNFSRNWNDYKEGFGSASGEYWIGNEVLHLMTSTRKYHLTMEAKASEGREVFGEWKTFNVDSEENKFKVTVSSFDASKGIIYDRLSYINAMSFTTFDVDLDKNSKNCAEVYKGGWWYNNCQYFNPTGQYGVQDDHGLLMNPWSKHDKAKRRANWIQMKIRPSICSHTISVASLNTHQCEDDQN